MIDARGYLSFVCLLACMPLAAAQGSKPLSALPPEGFSFNGSWDCAGSFGNKTEHRATFTGAVILEGKWLELT
jgi:hypothetical protein